MLDQPASGSQESPARLPTFVIVGAPKSGTTALATFLGHHPDVFVSNPKEPHFFDAAYDKGMAAYLRDHYGGWGQESAAGEATPSYLSVPYVAARIHDSLPKAKVIALLRNPVDRAYSAWWMRRARGMEPLSFAAAVGAERNALEAGNVLAGPDAEQAWKAHIASERAGDRPRIRMYLQSGWYGTHLGRYLDQVGPGRLRVVVADDLAADSREVVRGLWEELGVDPDFHPPDRGRVNEALGHRAAPLLRIARATRVMRLRSRLPEPTRERIKARLSRMGSQPPMDPQDRAELVAYFAPEVAKLETLLGRALSAWRA